MGDRLGIHGAVDILIKMFYFLPIHTTSDIVLVLCAMCLDYKMASDSHFECHYRISKDDLLNIYSSLHKQLMKDTSDQHSNPEVFG